MLKKRYRDYATEAFRDWARYGCPDVESIGRKHSTLSKGQRDDLKACARCMRKLKEDGRGEICEAVNDVYMVRAGDKLPRGELSARVVKFSMSHYVAERQVYEWLAEACREFAELRGLCVE